MSWLLGVAVHHAMRHKATSLVAIGISLVASAAVVALIGEATGRANDLLHSLQDARARSLVVRASDPDHTIPLSAARALASMPGVAVAVAVTRAESVTATALHDPNVSVGYLRLVQLRGDSPVGLNGGRSPGPGEVMLSDRAARTLRMDSPLTSGIAATSGELPVVGTFTPLVGGALSDLLDTVAVGPDIGATNAVSIVMLVREPADVAVMVAAVDRLIPDRKGLSVDYEERAGDIAQTVARAGAGSAGAVAAGIVLAATAIQLATALLTALLQRREHARRRALGFSRSEILTLSAIEAGLLGAVGATLGTALAAARLLSQHTVTQLAAQQLLTRQVLATIGLMITLSVLASAPGGVLAAYRDPARILRVP